jgi:hypothetical protein
MELRRERKRSLKVREQQDAEFERIEASKKRYGDFNNLAICLVYSKRVFIHRRYQKITELKAVKRQAETQEEGEKRRLQDSQAKAARRRSETLQES